jgi:uncharacterized membrane protein YbhN (UPF0104 family)
VEALADVARTAQRAGPAAVAVAVALEPPPARLAGPRATHPPGGPFESPAARARFRRPSIPRFAAILIAVLAVGAVFSIWDDAREPAGMVPGFARGAGSLRWQFGPILVALAVAHYLAAAVAVRAASGRRLGFTEVTLAQFAAAAANRLTPAGIGGAALNTRYLSRRGLAIPEAAGSMAALAILGPVTDLLLVLAVLGAGSLLGTTVGMGGIGISLARIGSLPGSIWGSGWLARAAILAGLAAAGGAAGWLVRRRITAGRGAPAWANRVGRPLARLARQPRQLAVLLAASAATTLILGVALAVSLRMVPGASAGVGVTTVVTVFVVGSAIGSAIPVPAGVGSTEASLVAALLATGIPAAHALRAVLLFRVVAFWVPPAFGIVAARRLRRLGAL